MEQDIENSEVKQVEDVVNSSDAIAICLSPSNRKKTFASPQVLDKFIQKEKDNFRFLLSQTEPSAKFISEIIFNQFYTPYLQNLEGIHSAWVNGGTNQLKAKIDIVEDAYRDFAIPFSYSSLGSYIVKTSKSQPIQAALIIFAYLNPNIQTTNQLSKTMLNTFVNFYQTPRNNRLTQYQTSLECLTGYLNESHRLLLKWELFGSSNAVESHKNQLDSALNDLYDVHNESVEKSNKFNEWLLAEQDDYSNKKQKNLDDEKSLSTRILKKSLKDKINVKKKILTEVKEATDRLALSEKTYKEKIELNESVGYWQTKENNHKTEMSSWFKYLLGSVGVTLVFPVLVMWFVSWLTSDSMNGNLILGAINPLVLAASIVTLSLCTYSIRFCSRQYASAKHLCLEATERRTMILTYLALMSEDKLKEQEDRKVALDTLFRPAQTGIVADTQSIMPTDSVVKVLSKKV